jgi:hypothetical protein
MAVNLSPIWGAGAQLLDNSGNVLTGGKIYTYAAGTTTPATTFTSSNGGIENSNPIILNAAGRVPYEIWLTDGVSYKFVLKDSNDTLIATYDNLIGINSNFVNFTNQQEIQTATAGQTVFNLVDVEYQPGTNSLTVFVDGVNQYGPGAQYAYVETDSNTVTFVSGLHVGASIKFTTSQLNSTVGSDATQVSYEPPFTNSVATNVAAKLAQTVSVQDFGANSSADVTEINSAMSYAIANNTRVIFPFSATIRVPEDAPTLQDAMDSSLADPSKNIQLTIQISAGHALTKGVVLVDVDYGNYKITSVDSVVYLAPSFSAVAPTSGVGAQNSIFYARRSKLPDIYCLFDMQSNFGSGVYLQEQSSGFISTNCGVKNAGHYGLLVSVQSAAVATQANFMGAAGGNAVTTGSFLTAPQANFSYAGGKPGADTAACLDVSRGSVVYITGQPGAETNLTHGLKRGLAVRRSFVSAAYIDVSNSGEFGYRIERGAWVNAYFGILNDVGIIAAYVDKSHLSMNDCVISNAGQYGIYGQHGADIIATDVQISNTTNYAAYVLRGSSIEMFQAVIDDTNGVYITQGSKANLERANITNTTGAIGRALRCQEGSNVNAADAVFGASTNQSIFISEGSFVNAVGATTKSGSTGVAVVGDTNVSAFNTIDGNKGVIWN